MDLLLLGLMVPIGIGLIVAAVHWSSAKADEPPTEVAFRDAFVADFPDEGIEWSELSLDRSMAVLGLGFGATGIVRRFGDGFVSRLVLPGKISVQRSGSRVTVDFDDFSLAGGHFDFVDSAAALKVERHLAGTKAPGSKRAA